MELHGLFLCTNYNLSRDNTNFVGLVLSYTCSKNKCVHCHNYLLTGKCQLIHVRARIHTRHHAFVVQTQIHNMPSNRPASLPHPPLSLSGRSLEDPKIEKGTVLRYSNQPPPPCATPLSHACACDDSFL